MLSITAIAFGRNVCSLFLAPINTFAFPRHKDKYGDVDLMIQLGGLFYKRITLAVSVLL